jgi:membrane-associated protease RseP (regulator of RpoE activity)
MDGGRMAMSLLKAMSGNRITPNAERTVYLVGFMALMALLAWITVFDIQRLGGG